MYISKKFIWYHTVYFVFESCAMLKFGCSWSLSQGEKQPSPEDIRASDHPTLLKYFKMEKVGVPPQAIKGKMKADGIDPNLLDEPNKIIRKDAFNIDAGNGIDEEEQSTSEDDYWIQMSKIFKDNFFESILSQRTSYA